MASSVMTANPGSKAGAGGSVTDGARQGPRPRWCLEMGRRHGAPGHASDASAHETCHVSDPRGERLEQRGRRAEASALRGGAAPPGG